jgi:hypothetical protein
MTDPYAHRPGYWQERALKAEAEARALREALDAMIAAHRDHALRVVPEDRA